MQGTRFEIQWRQGSKAHYAWAEEREDALFILVALRAQGVAESARAVEILDQWDVNLGLVKPLPANLSDAAASIEHEVRMIE